MDFQKRNLQVVLWHVLQVDQLTLRIRNIVSQGYIVRAFTDGATLEARDGYTYRRDQVMAAGAHLLSTDFPGGKTPEFFESTYSTEFADDAVVVCNPMTAPQTCASIDFIAKLASEEIQPGGPGLEENGDGRQGMEPQGLSWAGLNLSWTKVEVSEVKVGGRTRVPLFKKKKTWHSWDTYVLKMWKWGPLRPPIVM